MHLVLYLDLANTMHNRNDNFWPQIFPYRFMSKFTSNNEKATVTSCARVTLTLTFDLENGVWVTCDVGYLCGNFSLPRPLCSSLRADVRDRQTDIRQHHRWMTPPRGWGITIENNRCRQETQCRPGRQAEVWKMTEASPILSVRADAILSRSDHGKWRRLATTHYRSASTRNILLLQSRVMWATSVAILVFLGFSVPHLGPETLELLTQGLFIALPVWVWLHFPTKSFGNYCSKIVLPTLNKLLHNTECEAYTTHSVALSAFV